MRPLLEQLRARRKNLGLKQRDMQMRVGMSRQQYQRLETRGNPRLDTLELLAKGLESELLLVPGESLRAVRRLLEGESGDESTMATQGGDGNPVEEDPWEGVLGDGE